MKVGEWLAAHTASRLTVVSPVLRDYYTETYNVAAEFIPNGVVPIGRRAPQRMLQFGLTPGRYLLAVSRLVPEKGLHYLIEAFCRTRHDLQLVIAGGVDANLALRTGLKQAGAK